MNIVQLMALIEKDPRHILQANCIFQLRAFMRGFVVARNTETDQLSNDHHIMVAIDNIVRKKYNVLPTAKISIEEILDDFEQDNAYDTYLKIWSENINKLTGC